MPDEEQAAPPDVHRPALPDGSIPTYGGHPLAEDPPPPLGWGPDLSRFDELIHPTAHKASALLLVALIVLGGVAVSVLIAALSAGV